MAGCSRVCKVCGSDNWLESGTAPAFNCSECGTLNVLGQPVSQAAVKKGSPMINRLLEIRTQLGKTQMQMSELLDVEQATYGRWERGYRRIPRHKWGLLFARAGLPVEPYPFDSPANNGQAVALTPAMLVDIRDELTAAARRTEEALKVIRTLLSRYGHS